MSSNTDADLFFVHPFLEEIFMEPALCLRYCANHRGYDSEQDRKGL